MPTISDVRHPMLVYDANLLALVLWDGEVTLTAGTITIGVVDQGAPGAVAWKVDGSAVTQPVSGTVAVTSATLATAANQSTEITSLATLDTSVNTLLKPASTLAAVTSITNPVTVTSATLATEATLASLAAKDFSTAAKQDTGNAALATLVLQTDGVETSLSSIDGKLTSGIVISSMPASASAATATADDPTYTEGVAEPLSQDLRGRMRMLAYGLGESIPSDMAPEGDCTPLKTDRQGRLWIASDTLSAQFNRQIELLTQITIELRINNELLSAGMNLRENLDLYRSDQSISGNITLN